MPPILRFPHDRVTTNGADRVPLNSITAATDSVCSPPPCGEGLGVGVVVGGHTARNNRDPHPARLRFAPAAAEDRCDAGRDAIPAWAGRRRRQGRRVAGGRRRCADGAPGPAWHPLRLQGACRGGRGDAADPSPRSDAGECQRNGDRRRVLCGAKKASMPTRPMPRKYGEPGCARCGSKTASCTRAGAAGRHCALPRSATTH